MRNDEFNDIKITNVKGEGTSFEYGKIQKAEFTSYRDNKDLNRDELNPTTNTNNENVKYGHKQTNNNDLIDKTIQTASESSAAIEAGSSTAAVSSTASSSVAVTAGATSAVVAATAVVAVTVVSATVGINIFAKCSFDYLEVGSDAISYGLVLDTGTSENEDQEILQYRIWVEDQYKSYSSYQSLAPGRNEGSFFDLIPDTEYTISVTSLSVVGDTEIRGLPIYTSTIRTVIESTEPYVEFSWDHLYDPNNNSIDVELEIYDPDNIYSDFRFEITDGERSKTFSLEKENGVQTLLGDSSNGATSGDGSEFFDFGSRMPMSYVFYYTENGDLAPGISESDIRAKSKEGEFARVIFDGTADFSTNSFTVALDYYDPTEEQTMFTDFVLIVSDINGLSREYPLEATQNTQVISGEEGDDSSIDPYIDFSDPNQSFTVELRYGVNGDIDNYLVMENRQFVDSSGSIVFFNDFTIFEEADFETNTFYVQLDYQDDLGKLDDFHLYINGAGGYGNFELEKTTEKTGYKAVRVEESVEYPIDLSAGEFECYFSYTIYGNLAQPSPVTVIFTDYLNRESVINSVDINTEANFETQSFTADVDIVNTLGKISSARIELTDSGDSSLSKSFPLELEASTQTFNENSNFYLRGHSFNYEIYYTMVDSSNEELFDRGTVEFSDYLNRKSEITDISISQYADYNKKIFKASVTVVDDFNVINPNGNFIITQEEDATSGNPGGTYSGSIAINPNITSDQVLDFSNFEYLDLGSDTLTYQITYVDTELGTVNGPSGSVTFEGAETYAFVDDSSFVALPYNGNYYLPIKIAFNDPLEVYNTLELVTVTYDDQTGEEVVDEIIGYLDKTNDMQLIDVTDYIGDSGSFIPTTSFIGINSNNGLEGLREGQIEVADDIFASSGYLESLEIDSSSPELNLQLYLYNPAFADSTPSASQLTAITLIITDGNDSNFEFELEVDFDYFDNMYLIDLSQYANCEDFLNIASTGKEFDVQVMYQYFDKDSNEQTGYAYLYSSITFSIL